MATNSGPEVKDIPTVQVRRTIRARQQRVFDAWTTAEELTRWHAPGPLTVSLAEVDLRVGGRFRIHMREPDGKEHRVSGVYQLVDPPNKLVYSWGWDGDHVVKESTVTIEFLKRGDATEVVITHAIAGATERANHEKGWIAILDKLVTTYQGAAT
jgi:uncharacterized protein YndB with AHSA1/START domain